MQALRRFMVLILTAAGCGGVAEKDRSLDTPPPVTPSGPPVTPTLCAGEQEYVLVVRATGLSAFEGKKVHVMTSVRTPYCRADGVATIEHGSFSLSIRNRFTPKQAVYPDVAAYIDRDADEACIEDPAWSSVTTGFVGRTTQIDRKVEDFRANATACAFFR